MDLLFSLLRMNVRVSSVLNGMILGNLWAKSCQTNCPNLIIRKCRLLYEKDLAVIGRRFISVAACKGRLIDEIVYGDSMRFVFSKRDEAFRINSDIMEL